MSHGADRRRPSIAASMVALCIAAIAAATLLGAAVTFFGPPPRPAPIALDAVVMRLAGYAARGPDAARMIVTSEPMRPAPRRDEHFDRTRSRLIAERLGVSVSDVFGNFAEPARGEDSDREVRGDFSIAVRRAGGWQVIRTAPAPNFGDWQRAMLAATLAATILLALLAVAVARAITRPLVDLAAAADRSSLGDPAQLPESGPPEVARLAQALNRMGDRIAEQMLGRTVTFAAIAHDLATPLARLAFRLEQLPDADRDRALADIAEMRTLIADALRYGRDSAHGAPHSLTDLGSLIDSVVEDRAVMGMDVSLVEGPRVRVNGDPSALRRMLGNLIDNAARYGGSAVIGWQIMVGDHVLITIDDEGPGIDPMQVDRLFQPFVRGEPSRNRATGGSGLGLAIVRSVAVAHGGAASIANRETGGVRASVSLPLA